MKVNLFEIMDGAEGFISLDENRVLSEMRGDMITTTEYLEFSYKRWKEELAPVE